MMMNDSAVVSTFLFLSIHHPQSTIHIQNYGKPISAAGLVRNFYSYFRSFWQKLSNRYVYKFQEKKVEYNSVCFRL